MDSDLRQSPPQSWGRRGATAAPQAQRSSNAARPARLPVRSESGCQRYRSWRSSNPFRHSSVAVAAIVPVKHHHAWGSRVIGHDHMMALLPSAWHSVVERVTGHARGRERHAKRWDGSCVVLHHRWYSLSPGLLPTLFQLGPNVRKPRPRASTPLALPLDEPSNGEHRELATRLPKELAESLLSHQRIVMLPQ